MNPEAELYLKNILIKEPHELTPEDIGFMRARVAYIGRKSREKFHEALKGNLPPVKEEQDAKDAMEADGNMHPSVKEEETQVIANKELEDGEVE